MKAILKINFFLLPGIWLICFFSFKSYSQISITPFATGLSGITDVKNAGDDRLFVVEQAGRIRIVDRFGIVKPVPFLNISQKVVSGGEQGLLGLAFSPNYKNDGRFYVNYTGAGGHTHIARFHVSASNPDSAEASSEELLIYVVQPYSNHNGGCLQFGNDGYLYCSLGDGGSGGDPGDRAQDLKDTLGKMLRIDVSPDSGYVIPGDNPFVNNTNALDLTWAYGLRNPWRFSFDHITHDMWIGDVGQGIWEEIDFQPALSTGGENYGWRCYEGNHPYNITGCGVPGNYIPAVYDYPHSGPNGCSVTGGYVYRGAKYNAMFGKYFFVDYCSGLMHSLTKDTGSLYTDSIEGDFTDYTLGTFGEDQYGELYLGGYTTGIVYIIKDAGCTPSAYIYDKDTMYVCSDSTVLNTPLSEGFKYQWYFNGTLVAGADSNLLPINKNGWYRVRVTTPDDSCSNISSNVYVFFNIETASFTGLPSFICRYQNAAILSGNPAGGQFTGEGIAGVTFNPASVGTGTYNITYNYINSYGCKLKEDQSITVTDCMDHSQIFIAPNPTSDNLTVNFSLNINEESEITIYDTSGKLCFEKNIMFIYGTVQYHFNLPNLSSGVYTFQLKNSGTVIREKFVIAKAR